MKTCWKCGALNQDDLSTCDKCGHPLRVSERREDTLPDAEWGDTGSTAASSLLGLTEDVTMASTGGLLILISGIIMCLSGLSTVVGGAAIEGMLGVDIDSGYVAIGIGVVILGVLISLAGRDAMRRRGWKWALVSCVIIMLFGQVMLALGTAALVLIAVSRQDFIE